MPEYDNTNRGAIWPNDKKDTDRHPDFKGSLNVDGVEFWLSAWKRKPDANPKAPSLKFSIERKDKQPNAPLPERAGPPSAQSDIDEEIPF